ncbi:dephospho-CoA kinase [Bacteroidota bacterium]
MIVTTTLGVTGGIGSGKSTVCDILATLGARIFRADDVGKQLMIDDQDVRREVTDAFGADSYTSGGELNAAYLSARVFADPDQVQVINTIVHPRVLAAFEIAKTMARREGVPLLALESALLFQSGGHMLVDFVAVVEASPPVRRRRVMARDDVSRAAVEARMRFQMEPEELRRRADYLIPNQGSIDELRDAVSNLYQQLVDPRGPTSPQ